MYHMGRGDEKLCFCSNRSRTLVAMVAYSSRKDLYYTERIKFSNFFLKCLYCCCFEKYYNAADHIQLVLAMGLRLHQI